MPNLTADKCAFRSSARVDTDDLGYYAQCAHFQLLRHIRYVWVEDEKACVSVVLIYPLKKAKGGLRVLTDSVTHRFYEPNPPSFLITLFFDPYLLS